LNSTITRRTWFSSVWSTSAICPAETWESDSRMICARWRRANTFD
jgi:hypothetical protein